MDFHQLRREYRSMPLNAEDLNANPIKQLYSWLEDARDHDVIEPNAMTLATATREGRPSSRTVLLKEIDADGLIFYTSYESRKGRELAENPYCSLTFYWKEIERQVTIDGTVEKVPEKHSENYFSKRPRESQLGAWSSRQGQPIPSRSILDDAYKVYSKQFEGEEVSKPPYWGGFKVIPTLWIFWQGRKGRLHDRFLYTQDEKGQWNIQRISP